MPATTTSRHQPLWRRGSHVSQRTTSTSSSRGIDSRGINSRGADSLGIDDRDRLGEWISNHPRALSIEDLPGGEIEAKLSGVFGAYASLPQVTVRLVGRLSGQPGSTSVLRDKGAVPVHDPSGSLLKAALAMPIVTHRFS